MPDTNLPLQLTRFIGREAELAEIGRRLSLPATRLLTLTGAGGIGKTRLALEVASGRLEAHPQGVWLVELAALAEAGRLPQAVADTFELRATTRQPVMTTLANALRNRNLLLVLDNCEHLIEACAPLAEALLKTCPKLQILATSREALGILGETIWAMTPLSVPNFWRWPATETGAAVLQYEAVRLFVDRASHFSRDFALTNQNALAVAQICFGLDGLPLAIELAAARTRTLSVEQIAARLDDRFRWLGSGSRTALPRHQTLRAVIDWSYDQLPERERLVFERLSVFVNGWTLEAAEAVCAGEANDPGRMPAAAVAELLGRLVSKSLVHAEERDGAMRYQFLEIIRQYALTQLEDRSEAEAVRRGHLDFFLRIVKEAAPRLIAADQRAWSNRVEAEHDNLRAAWAWALKRDPASALGLAWALRLFWYRGGYLNEAQEWSTQLLDRVELADRPLALNLAGVVANWQYNHNAARAFFEQSLEALKAGPDEWLEAVALQGSGVAAMGLGQLEAAGRYLEQSLAAFRMLGYEWSIANVLGGLCVVLADQGEYAQASQAGVESLALYQKLGDRAGAAQPLLNLGELARAQGDYAAAAAYYEQCLDRGTKSNQAAAQLNLGQVAVRQGQYRRAKELLGAGLAFYREQNNAAAMGSCLTGLAGMLAATGKPLPAARLFGAVDEWWRMLGTAIHAADRADYDYHLAKVRTSLDAASFAQAQASGRQLSVEQAVELALSEVANTGQAADHGGAPETGPAQPELVIQTLGPARAWRGGREIASADWRYAKARELLFYLLCQPPQTKEQIGLALWPDASPGQIRNNLGVTLHYLRRALGHSDWIIFEQERYTFNRALNYQYDLEAFEAGIAKARHLTGAPSIAYLKDAIRLYRGEFAADLTESDWPSARREALQQRYLEALLRLGGLLLAEGHYPDAAEAYRSAIAADSYVEQAHRELMRCLARMGERGQAVRHYQGLRAHLREQVGAPPAPETTALYERLKQGDAI